MHNTGTRWTITFTHYRFVILMMGFCFITALRVVGLSIPVVVYLGISMLLCAVSSPEEIVSFMCSLICFSTTFQYRFALLICIVWYLIKKGIKRINIKYLIPLLLMMIWELLHFSQSGLTAHGFCQEFSELIALTALMIESSDDYSDALPMRTFSYCAVFSCFISLTASVRLQGFSFRALTRLGETGVDVDDFQSLMDPNTMSYICIMAIAGLLLVNFRGNKKHGDSICLSVLLVFILLSQSRAAVGSLLVCLVLFHLLSGKAGKVSVDRLIKGTLIAMLVVAVSITVFGNVLTAFIGRFNSADITTGRGIIFSFYNMHLLQKTSNWLFGIGLFEYNTQITNVYGGLWKSYPGLAAYHNGQILYKPCHNNLQEIVVVWGLIGLVLVTYFIIKMIQHYPHKHDKRNFVPLLLLLIYGLQGEFLSSGCVLLALIFSFVCLEYAPKHMVDPRTSASNNVLVMEDSH